VYYHVRITPRTRRRSGDDELALDLTAEQVEQRFLDPYRRGLPITTGGRTFALSDIERIRVNRTAESSEQLLPHIRAEQQAASANSGIAVLGGPSYRWYVTTKGENVTDELITGPPGSATTGTQDPEFKAESTRKVMVVHGRNLRLTESLFAFLRALGLDPLEWTTLVHSTGTGAPYIGDVLDEGFAIAHAVVVLMTPDDQAQLVEELRGEAEPPHEIELTPQARPNVIFEAGMAFGRFPDRTVIVEIGNLRPFSDVAGRHIVRLDNSTQRRQDLALRLRACGCDVGIETGTDWHTAGDFRLDGASSGDLAADPGN
jgi:predicted nucleotide-binding protein